MTTSNHTCGLAVLFTGLLFVQLASAAQEPTKDALDTVKKNLDDEKAVLVDVRSTAEWDEGHLKEAVMIPLTRLEKGPSPDDLEKLVPKKKIVYIYCRSGRRALRAGEILAKFGYEVRVLKPGYEDLLKAGFQQAERGDLP